MKNALLHPVRAATVMALAAVLAACASAPPTNARLDEAREAYDKALADALVARSAPVELQQAQQALQRADAELRAGEDRSAVEHYAYLARQRVEIARQSGLIAQADQAVAQSRAQRDRILIEARAREAEVERDRADKARAAAEQSRVLAEKSRTDAEAARKLAEDRLAAAEAARQQAEAARLRASTLESQLAALKAKQTERGMVLTLGDVLFDTAQATLKAGAMRTVDQLAEFLAKNPSRKVLVEGHTDSVGSDEYNRELSRRRADAVRQALIDRRIGGERVDVAGLGEVYPVASNDTAPGRQQNRRVEVIFSDEAGSIRARGP